MAGSLDDYIKEGLRRGYSENDLRQALLNQGWGMQDINQAFASLQDAGGQKPMQPIQAGQKPQQQPKKKLRRIGVFSSAKMSAIVSAFMGLIAGVFQAVLLASLMPVLSMLVGPESAVLMEAGFGMFAGLGLIMIILVPAFMAIIGFMMGALVAFAYNLLAGRLGGFELEFE